MKPLPIVCLRIPNPFVEGRNRVYVIKSDPVTLIDTGIATARAFAELTAGLKQHRLSPSDIKRIILTHKHIDHIGNAWRFQQEAGAEILIHENEAQSVTSVDPDGKKFAELVEERLRDWCVPQEAYPDQSSSRIWKWEIESAQPVTIMDGQRIVHETGEFEVIHTPGHTMGSICLKYDKYLFSGDHILPDISPNIGGGDLRNRGMLRHYMQSLERITKCAEPDTEVLPGHGEPFATLALRCDELLTHHNERLDKVLGILRTSGEQSLYQVAYQLFGEMQEFHVVLGCAEAAAHLEFLEQEGRVASQASRYSLA